MSTPNASQANAASLAAKNMIVNADQARFVADAEQLIAVSESKGQYRINMNIVPNVSVDFITNYFTTLGYQVTYTDRFNPSPGPAGLFGIFWTDFWNNVPFPGVNTAYRVCIQWNT